MPDFANKAIIITGASEGIGRALALELAPQAPRLVLAARNRERLESLAKECEAAGAATLVCRCDVTGKADCETLVRNSIDRFGQIDILVNNAGATMWADFSEVNDLLVFREIMDINYLGAVYCTHFALPHLLESQGLIVAVASLAGLTGVPSRTGYAASKHAMVGFFDSLRIELRGTGVDVSIIAPDFVVSQIHRRNDAHINYLGAVYCTHFALPHLLESQGLIVAVASLAGLTGVPSRTGYAASKHAMVGFFDSLRIELRGTGVDVSIIAPDFVVSQIHRRALKGDGEIMGETPMQEARIMTAEDCAALIAGAMKKRQRLLITSVRGKLGRWLKLIAPALIDRIAERAIRLAGTNHESSR